MERGNECERSGKTALLFAFITGHVDCVRYFVEHGVDVNAIDMKGSTALMAASSFILCRMRIFDC